MSGFSWKLQGGSGMAYCTTWEILRMLLATNWILIFVCFSWMEFVWAIRVVYPIWTDFPKIFRIGWTWYKDQLVTFFCWVTTPFRIWLDYFALLWIGHVGHVTRIVRRHVKKLHSVSSKNVLGRKYSWDGLNYRNRDWIGISHINWSSI